MVLVYVSMSLPFNVVISYPVKRALGVALRRLKNIPPPEELNPARFTNILSALPWGAARQTSLLNEGLWRLHGVYTQVAIAIARVLCWWEEISSAITPIFQQLVVISEPLQGRPATGVIDDLQLRIRLLQDVVLAYIREVSVKDFEILLILANIRIARRLETE